MPEFLTTVAERTVAWARRFGAAGMAAYNAGVSGWSFLGSLPEGWTFGRNSIQTGVDADGDLYIAEYRNQLLWSEGFNNGVWAKGAVSIDASVATSPFGDASGDKVFEHASTVEHYLQQSSIPISIGATYTYSVYAKAAERSRIVLSIGASRLWSAFNLSDGTHIQSGSSADFANPTYAITHIGDSWYRISISGLNVGYSSGQYARIALMNDVVTPTYTPVYTGDGTSGIYIWGAQLNRGPTALPYVKTEASAIREPAFVYNEGVLLEGSRTNLAKYSDDFSGWSSVNTLAFGAGSTVNATNSPDSNLTADFVVPNTSSAAHGVSQAVTVTATGYTVSVFVKAGGYSKVGIREGAATGSYATFSLSGAGSVIASLSSTATITAHEDGWYRVSMTYTGTAAAHTYVLYILNDAYTTGSPHSYAWAGDGTSGLYLWGAQLEAAAFASSYIPTTSAAGIRAATSLTYTWNFPSNNFSGQIVVRPGRASSVSPDAMYLLSLLMPTNDPNNRVAIYANNGDGYIILNKALGGTSVYSTIYDRAYSANERLNIRFRVDSTGIYGWVNDGGKVSLTSSIAPNNFSTGLTRIQPVSGTYGTTNDFGVVESLKIWNEAKSDQFLDDLYVVPEASWSFLDALPESWVFDRNSIQTGVDEDGDVYVADYANQLTRSSQLNNAAWTKANVSVSSDVVATFDPIGGNNADKVISSAGAANHYFHNSVSIIAGTVYTYSFYAKAAEYTWVQVTPSTGFAVGGYVNINLATGQIGASSNNGGVFLWTVTEKSNGWWRITATQVGFSTTTGMFIVSALDANTASRLPSYTGDGTSGIYIWGSQLNRGSIALPYTDTVTAAIRDPAFIHDEGVLLEGARTNLALQSETFGATWTVGAASIDSNTSATTDPAGGNNADAIVEDGTPAAPHRVVQAMSVTAGTAYTLSVYAKQGARRYLQLVFGTTLFPVNAYGNFDLQSGTIVSTGAAATSSITPAANGFYRVMITATATGTGLNSQFINPSADGSSINFNGVNTQVATYLWGAQLEAGAFASSYIPTTSGAGIRATTSLTRSWNFPTNDFSGQVKFTINPTQSAISSTQVVLEMYAPSGGSRYSFRVTSTYIALYKVVESGNTATYSMPAASGFAAGDAINLRFKQSSAGLSFWVNDLPVYTNSGATAQSNLTYAPTSVYLGANYVYGDNANITVESLTIWNKAKSDAFLEALT